MTHMSKHDSGTYDSTGVEVKCNLCLRHKRETNWETMSMLQDVEFWPKAKVVKAVYDGTNDAMWIVSP